MFDIFDFFKNFIERIKQLECCCDDNNNDSNYKYMPPHGSYNIYIQR